MASSVGDLSEIMTAEFETKLNALKGHDVAPFKECLTAIEVAVHAHLIAKCEDIMNDDGSRP